MKTTLIESWVKRINESVDSVMEENEEDTEDQIFNEVLKPQVDMLKSRTDLLKDVDDATIANIIQSYCDQMDIPVNYMSRNDRASIVQTLQDCKKIADKHPEVKETFDKAIQSGEYSSLFEFSDKYGRRLG